MNERLKDDIFYVCCLIEYLVRKTHNPHKTIISYFSKADIERLVRNASVNHCLSFEQVSDEIIEEYQIQEGTEHFNSKYPIPSFQAIGRVYQMLIWNVCEDGDCVESLMQVFRSFICEEISDYNSNIYYSNPDYLKYSYLEGKMLA